MRYLYTYLIATALFFTMDMVWLGVIAKDMYRTQLSFIFTGQVNWAAAIVFYLIYIAGIVYFAINPALKEINWQLALVNGVLLGGLCYATYDLTNLATIARWPLLIVVVDIIWGMFLTGTVSVITYVVANRWL